MSYQVKLFGLIAAMTGLRLAASACLPLGNDEAYHALYRLNPAWCYYDHPPMVAWIASVGPWLSGGLENPFSLRLGFVGLAACSTWLMARITRRSFGERAGLLAAFLYSAAGYYGLAAGVFVLPDCPLLFFWLLAFDRLVIAQSSRDRALPWALVGLAWGGALLSKFIGFLFPLGVICWWLAERGRRSRLAVFGPCLALLVGLLVAAPVLAWNAENGWASFRFQGSRAAVDEGGLEWWGPVVQLGGQVLYLFPWVWIALARAFVKATRGGSLSVERACLAIGLPVLVLFLSVSLWRSTLPHWALAGYVTLVPLAGRDWAERIAAGVRMPRRITGFALAPVLVVALAIGQSQFGIVAPSTAQLGERLDPTLDGYGWEQVTEWLRQRGLLEDPGTFFATGRWYDSAQLAMATGKAGSVACFQATDARGFAYWSDPSDWVGRTGVFVVIEPSSTEPAAFERYFEVLAPIGRLSVRRGGAEVKRIAFYRGTLTKPFPFGNGVAVAARESSRDSSSNRSLR